VKEDKFSITGSDKEIARAGAGKIALKTTGSEPGDLGIKLQDGRRGSQLEFIEMLPKTEERRRKSPGRVQIKT